MRIQLNGFAELSVTPQERPKWVTGALSSVLGCLLWMSIADAKAGSAVLVATNSVWQYLSDGSDPGSAWRRFDFIDDDWFSGLAELGYGDEVKGRPEATIITVDPNLRPITTYFRKIFRVQDTVPFTNLIVRLLRDDGAIVYFNEQEVMRSGMPAGPIAFNTPALAPGTSGIDETRYFSTNIGSTLLRPGNNVIAVEVHQISTADSDLSFALELIGEGDLRDPSLPQVTRGAYLQSATTTNIVVRWRTNLPTNSLVEFGLSAQKLSGSVGSDEPTVDHSIQLTNLAPDTRYYYSVGTRFERLQGSPEHTFVTHPIHPKPTRIWVLGDCGTAAVRDLHPEGTENSIGVRDAYYRLARDVPPDVWLLLGDNAYNVGSDTEFQTAIFETYPRTLRQTAAWPTIGNHDAATLNAAPYLDIFTLPSHGEAGGTASGTERYYSFEYSDIHFVCLDSQSSGRTNGSAMLMWLRADLEANLKPWLIAYWHHPPYSKGSHNSDRELELGEMRTNTLPILEEFGVDLVLGGHSHSYERSYLLDGHYGDSPTLRPSLMKDAGDGRPEGTGPYIKASPTTAPHEGAVYVVAGSSGWTTGHYGLNHPAMCVSLPTRGSVVVDVEKGRLDLRFLTDTDQIADHFTLLKGGSPSRIRIAKFRVTDGKVTAAWKSSANFNYSIEVCDQLTHPNWRSVSGPIPATGATSFWQSDLATLPATAYFRVIELGPTVN